MAAPSECGLEKLKRSRKNTKIAKPVTVLELNSRAQIDRCKSGKPCGGFPPWTIVGTIALASEIEIIIGKTGVRVATQARVLLVSES